MHSSIASPRILRFMESKSFFLSLLGSPTHYGLKVRFQPCSPWSLWLLGCKLGISLSLSRTALPTHALPLLLHLLWRPHLVFEWHGSVKACRAHWSVSRTSNDSSNERHRPSFRHPSWQHPTQTPRGKLISLRADCALGRLYLSYVSRQTEASFTRISISLLVTGEGNSS